MSDAVYAAYLGARRALAALMPSAEAQPKMARTAALACLQDLPPMGRAKCPQLAGICVQLVEICAKRSPEDPALTKLVMGGLSVFDAFLKVEAGQIAPPDPRIFAGEKGRAFVNRLRGGGHG